MRTALVALAVALSSCTTIDTTLREHLPTACARLQTTHAAFQIIAETGKISTTLVKRERAVYSGVAVFCDDPSSVTSANAPVLVAAAVASIIVLLEDAKS